ncbi:cytochrome c oxidase subunit II [Segetibacter sp.]|jgi:cytochrome c oxidase subunit 2|uniref:cytochrome c oxidase subunit II n=1 Tax=Segetibacter sp. TaxID=2231182 RepID=UPI00261E8EF9|nr:cytochrome c oxidase subunit II [Segetibacter sp.]MCW3080697.1 cytochrome c oxidase subunit [Segetibacter sp.]
MSTFFIIAVLVLLFVVIFQIAKASEYVAILKGEEKARKHDNKINGFLMIAFLVLGLIGVYYCHEILKGRVLSESASIEGEKVDEMLNITLAVTGIVFIITQVLLFWFAYKYQESEKRKVFFFPHNNTMEVVWTVVPAIVLSILVVIGLRNWFIFTGDAPKESLIVEVTGRQFGWIFRYPGKDNQFGKRYFRNIDPSNNNLGLVWADNKELNQKADPATFDDIVNDNTMYVIKGRPVKLIIGSRDVIHDVGLVHFRLKMDAVPGIPTTLWFTPKYTTAEMKTKTGNSNFQYEISCNQMCGNGHYSMKGIIEVLEEDEYYAWIAKQKPYYYGAFPEKDPSAAPPTPGGVPSSSPDSAASITTASVIQAGGGQNNKLK